MKFYALVDQNKLLIPAEGKVIPREEFSYLLAGEELLGVIDQEKQRLVEEHQKLVEELHKSGEEKGFAEGLKQWSQQLMVLENGRKEICSQVTKTIVPLALAAVKKIIGKELEGNTGVIVEIVKTALKPVSQHRKIKIFVSKQDLDTLEAHRQEIKGIFENLESLAIAVRDEIAPGGCVIETEAGIINVQLDRLLDALEGAFKEFFKNWSIEGET